MIRLSKTNLSGCLKKLRYFERMRQCLVVSSQYSLFTKTGERNRNKKHLTWSNSVQNNTEQST